MDQRVAEPHGYRLYDHQLDPTNTVPHPVEGEDEHHHEKKSVLKKVKAKAKKIKDTLKLHGHGHHDHDQEQLRPEGHVPDDHDLDEEDDDDDDEEMIGDPEVHGASGYNPAAVRDSAVAPGQSTKFVDNYPSEMHEDATERSFNHGQYEDKGVSSVVPGETSIVYEVARTPVNSPAAHVSVSPAINVEGAKGTAPDSGGQGQTSVIFEPSPAAHVSVTPAINVESTEGTAPDSGGQGQTSVISEPMWLEEDPHAPKDVVDKFSPSNYQAKVTDPTHAGGEEAGVSPVLSSFSKMNIDDHPKPESEAEQLDENEPQPHNQAAFTFPTGRHDHLSSFSKMNIDDHPKPESELEQLDENESQPHNQPAFTFPTGSHDQFSPEAAPPVPITTQESSQSSSVSVPEQSDVAHTTEDKEEPTGQGQGSYTEKISSATSVIADIAISAKNVIASSKVGYGDNTRLEGEDDAGRGTSSAVEYGKKIAATVTQKLAPVYEKVADVGGTVVSKVYGTKTATVGAKVKEQDKGVSVKEYVTDKLRPGEEDRALSEIISEVLHHKGGPAGKEEGKTTTVEVAEADEGEVKRQPDTSSSNVPGKAIAGKIKDAVGSWFEKGRDSPTHQPSHRPTDDSSAGTQGISRLTNEEKSGVRRIQESVN
ncbi:hypothetical protein Tsubulata_043785 [Turnera subulata]|uniref:Low-temperature-induced 65 kDa protein n=1 Tax=Turnera subulata TaxID=218843 RepID=A0A9Q0G218_9ROSI|nr:hypothetical protein Tsubulata_043785 [Turnera subulata]